MTLNLNHSNRKSASKHPIPACLFAASLGVLMAMTGCGATQNEGSDPPPNSSSSQVTNGSLASQESGDNNPSEIVDTPRTSAKTPGVQVEAEQEKTARQKLEHDNQPTETAKTSDPESPSDSPDSPTQSTENSWSHFRGGSSAIGSRESKLPQSIEKLWEYQIDGTGFKGAPLIVGNVVLAVDMDGLAIAIDLKTGTPLWQKQMDLFVDASPTYHEGLILFGDLDGGYYCLDAKNGEVVWERTIESSILSSANIYQGHWLTVGEGGELMLLEHKTGEIKWSLTLDDRILSSPSIIEDRCFLTGCKGELYVVNLKDQTLEPSVKLAAPTGVTAALQGDLAYFSVSGGTIMAANWKTQEVVWDVFDPMGDQEGLSSPAIRENTLIIGGGSSRKIKALNIENGEERWTKQAKRMVQSSPVIAGPDVIIGSHDGRVYVFDVESGDERFKFECGGVLSAAAAISGSRFVVTTDRGGVYCFGE